MPKRLQVVALFGDPVSHSLSPVIHNAAFAALGLDFAYLPFRTGAGGLTELLGRLRPGGLVGANFTYPCKTAAGALCDRLSPEASAVRAVNAAQITPDAVTGYNFDGYGFERALEEWGEADWMQGEVIILGAGAAARACGYVLHTKEVSFSYAVRDPLRVRWVLPAGAPVIPLEGCPARLSSHDVRLVVNATPVGLSEGDGGLFSYCLLYTSPSPRDS